MPTLDHPELRARAFERIAETIACDGLLFTHVDRAGRDDLSGAEIKKLYGRRFTIEETFRDTKDLHFGLGLSSTHIKIPARRDRLLLLVALAETLLTLLGAAGESIGMDRAFKRNTVTKRTLSLFRQGSYWYSAKPSHGRGATSGFDDRLRRNAQKPRGFQQNFWSDLRG